MKVFKFGGASVKDAAAIRNVKDIISKYKDDKLVVVISATGKTTNALEEVVNAFYQRKDNAYELLDEVRQSHYNIIDELFEGDTAHIKKGIDDSLFHVEVILKGLVMENFDFLYDQVVSAGELISTKIVSAYLNETGIENEWIDARSVVRTDNTYREAKIDWNYTVAKANSIIAPIVENKIVITQGFIGGTPENFTTTLGREGSDFTASILAYCLDAEGVYIWKDVPGVLNADPRVFSSVSKLDFLSYRDAIEMTYYGAKVIHPKTIKPLQNKGIPLYVRSFINPDVEGTQIKANLEYSFLPPVIVIKNNQIQLYISTKDFSFIAEENLSFIYSLFAQYRIKINLMQNTAISFTVCFDNDPAKLKRLLDDLQKDYVTEKLENLKLITIKHFNDNIMNELKSGSEVLLEERMKDTAQLLLKEKDNVTA